MASKPLTPPCCTAVWALLHARVRWCVGAQKRKEHADKSAANRRRLDEELRAEEEAPAESNAAHS
jgi:hypothetical protein